MRGGLGRVAVALAVMLGWRAACAECVQAAELPTYQITGTLSLSPPQVRGTVQVTFTNRSAAALGDLVLLLFPNRFAVPDTGVNDVNRPFVYPYQDFVPGWMNVSEVRVQGQLAAVEPLTVLPAGWALRVTLPAPLVPGAELTVSVGFETVIPARFGTLGEYDDMLTAVGGWYPYLAGLEPDGSWAVDAPPALADFDVQLAVSPDLDVLLNGQYFPRPAAPLAATVSGVHYLSLVAAPELLREVIEGDGGRIVFFHRPDVLTQRLSPGADFSEIRSETLRRIVDERPPAVPGPAGDIVVVAAPLRLDLTAAGEGMVLVSDRALKVLWLIRPFHEVQLAQAFYAEMLRPSLSRRESAGDYPWVSEGLSHHMAQQYREREYAENRSVQEWIELFNIFSIVDRFETEPKIPFVRTFFERQAIVDPLHEQIGTYNNDLPPGHVILGKLHHQVGDPQFEAVIERCTGGNQPFRTCAASASATDLNGFFAQWVQPFPSINYDFPDVQFNERRPAVQPRPLPPGQAAQGAEPSEPLPQAPVQTEEVGEEEVFEHSLTVRRTASREIHEPVDVRLQSIGGQHVDVRWDGSGDQAHLTVVTAGRMQQAIIDPDRTLIETTRADNAVPPIPQIVLDTAEVEVSSTEFGISGLVVARGRYDYQKDLAAAGIYTNRGIGGTFGGRYHWGVQNDPTLYRNNLYGFYSIAALDHSFKDKQHPTIRTTGHINGLGLRYDYNNIVNYDNPTHEVQVQLFADWFDQALGSNFNFVDWGGSLVLTHPLWSYRTILAGEIFNGFSEPLGSGVVPLQGLFSLGGSRSIRGIGAEEELARNIFIVRGELRQSIYPELDLNLLDFLVLRRAQLRAFVDTGNVSNSAGAIYNPSGYAVGVGLGFGAVYEFMGFFPSLAYLEVATRVDEASQIGNVQVLFGTRQSF